MSISENIRRLASEGRSVSDISRQLGISYQHAYNVMKTARDPGGSSPSDRERPIQPVPVEKPPLFTAFLVEGGFSKAGRWLLSEAGEISTEVRLPAQPGVYAFARDGRALYVGVATMGLSKRIYFYARPGITQKTSIRLNGMLKAELEAGNEVEIYIVSPPDLQWNGMPVHGCAGLELGLINSFSLPWNIRSAIASMPLIET